MTPMVTAVEIVAASEMARMAARTSKGTSPGFGSTGSPEQDVDGERWKDESADPNRALGHDVTGVGREAAADDEAEPRDPRYHVGDADHERMDLLTGHSRILLHWH
jgi:hypothetical protein